MLLEYVTFSTLGTVFHFQVVDNLEMKNSSINTKQPDFSPNRKQLPKRIYETASRLEAGRVVGGNGFFPAGEEKTEEMLYKNKLVQCGFSFEKGNLLIGLYHLLFGC
jgi:hypothetical protein